MPSIKEIIEKRTSIRTYKNKPVDPDLQNVINKLIELPWKGFFGNKIKFHLIQKQSALVNHKVKLGTYGFISGAQAFIAGSVKNALYNFEDFGYCLEKLILQLTELGLGTCWLGGTFSREKYAQVLKTTDEVIPAITPVGYATENRGTKEKLIRWQANANNRKPWNELFFENNFSKPLSKDAIGKYIIPLEMVRLAPSASNHQPWRIIKDNNKFHFFLQRKKGYADIIKSSDLQRIDMGIAMCHFDLMAKELNLNGNWKIMPYQIELKELMEYSFSWSY